MLLAAFVLTACAEREARCGPEQIEGVAYWRAASAVGPFTEFRLTVTLQSGSIVCHREVDGDPIHYLTFERAAGADAYGVYALAGAKNGKPIDPPLSGDSVTWPNRNEAQALVHLLTLAGVDAERAGRFLEARGHQIFADGLRVIFVLTSEDRPTVLAIELRR